MAKLWAVVRREYLERVRTKWFLIATIFGPLIFAAILILPLWLTMRTTRASDVSQIQILDATGTTLGRRIAAVLAGGVAGDTTAVRVLAVEPEQLDAAETAATVAVVGKSLRGYLVLPPDVLADTSVRYAGRNASSPVDVARLESAVRQGVLAHRLEREGLDPERVIALTRIRLSLDTEQITDRGREGSGEVRFIFAISVAFLLYMSILLYGQNVLRGVMEEKSTRVAEVVVSSVSADTLLAGKVLGVGAVGLTQQVIWIISAIGLARARAPLMHAFGLPVPPLQLPTVSPGMLLLLLGFFVLGFVLYSALFAAVGAMVNSEHEAQQAQQPIILLVVASAILIQPILLDPTSRLAQVVSLVPFSAPIIMPMRLSVVPVPASEVAASLAVLLLACVAAIWASSRIYRVGLLMYGKRPTLRELGRWIRMAR